MIPCAVACRAGLGHGPRPDAPDALAQRWRGQRPGSRCGTSPSPTRVPAWAVGSITSSSPPSSGDPYAHGWAAVFRPGTDARARPVRSRARQRRSCGARPVDRGRRGARPSAACGARPGDWPGTCAGATTPSTRARRCSPSRRGPGSARRFPAAQVVAVPSAVFDGTIRVGHDVVTLVAADAVAASAHIYGHGNAAAVGVVARRARRRRRARDRERREPAAGARPPPPLAFVQLRLGGRDWPRDPLAAAPLFRTQLGLPTWQCAAPSGAGDCGPRSRSPRPARCGSATSTPTGPSATCANSEIADAEIVLEHRRATWEVEARWQLRACAHAEIGSRP